MTQWHGDAHKRKKTGGKKGVHRKKRRNERGRDPIFCLVGEEERVILRTRGGNEKQLLKSSKFVNLYDPSKKRVIRTTILGVKSNPANRDLERRGVITRGAVIETELGEARVTSKPGADGVINAVLIKQAETSLA
ncbi:MAG: 30S ribosomal protein S8e [Nitrososphaerota archaeon]